MSMLLQFIQNFKNFMMKRQRVYGDTALCTIGRTRSVPFIDNVAQHIKLYYSVSGQQ